MLVVIAASVLALAGVVHLSGQTSKAGNGAGTKTYQKPDLLSDTSDGGGPFDVLVLGVDKRPGSAVEGGGTRTDTMMVARVYPDTGEIKLLSIPRDLLVQVKPGVEDRINTAYEYGGVAQAASAVENLTGVPIDHYAVVDFEGFKKVVDAMGGVKIDVRGQFPPGRNLREGVHRLNGSQALFYARYRHTRSGDLGRIERQQQMVAALRSQALSWNSVSRMPEIARASHSNVKTDVSLGEMISLGKTLLQKGRNARMSAVRLKGTPYTRPNGDEVLRPDARENRQIIQSFLY